MEMGGAEVQNGYNKKEILIFRPSLFALQVGFLQVTNCCSFPATFCPFLFFIFAVPFSFCAL